MSAVCTTLGVRGARVFCLVYPFRDAPVGELRCLFFSMVAICDDGMSFFFCLYAESDFGVCSMHDPWGKGGGMSCILVCSLLVQPLSMNGVGRFFFSAHVIYDDILNSHIYIYIYIYFSVPRVGVFCLQLVRLL